MNPLEKQSQKWVWLSVVFAVAATGVVVWHFKTLSDCEELQPSVTITFPNGFMDVTDKDDFVKALNAHTKPINSTEKYHVLYWDRDLISGGVPGKPTSNPDAGSHVTQWVSFSCMAQLEQFAEQAKGDSNCAP